MGLKSTQNKLLSDAPEIKNKLATFDEILTKSGSGFWAFDRDLRFIYWNKNLEKMSGLSSDQVLGQKVFQLFSFLKQAGEEKSFERVLNGEDVVSKKLAFKVLDTSREIFIDAYYSPLRMSNSEVCGGVTVVQDFTEFKLREDEAKEIETRFIRMADTSPVLLWMAGLDSTCVFFNQTWLKFTGRTMEQERGVGWAEGVHPEDFQDCMDVFNSNFRARREFEMEYRLRRYDGEYRWILDRGTPRYGPNQKFAGYIGSCIDITERRQLEKDLRSAISAREEFISIASHEIRTPLTSLKLQLQMFKHAISQLPEKPINIEKAQTMIDIAERQVVKLVQLVQDLLDVSQLQDGRTANIPQRQQMSLKALTQSVIERFSWQISAAGCQLELISDGDPMGNWDRKQLDQVVVNLLTNAIKYGARSKITIKISQVENTALLSVQDGGIGIQEKDQSRIFDQYARAVPTEHYGGLGLGLYIVRRIVEGHGGKISVQSDYGHGATFRVELPLDLVS